jgi:hypothetical protein
MSIAISLNLNFVGIVLPVVESEDGLSHVPMKPLVKAMGVDWICQCRKIKNPCFRCRLGVR